MAQEKKGFILYADQKALFEQLPNEKAGELISLFLLMLTMKIQILKILS